MRVLFVLQGKARHLCFSSKCLTQFSAKSEIVPEVVNERLTFALINIISMEHEIFSEMYPKDFDLDRRSAAELLNPGFSFQHVNSANLCFKLRRAFFHSWGGHAFACYWGET